MQHLTIVVKGRVQGVYFRVHAQKKARQLSINGTVTNRPDGDVEIQAAGNKENMQEFVQWCHKGPLLASVKAVALTELPLSALYTDFTILD